MRERDNSTPRSTKRTPIVAASGGDVAGEPTALEDGAARVEQRSAHRTKRPPPLPSRKAHKIKRIKSQRSTPWAALEPERMRQLGAASPTAAELAEMPMNTFGATTVIRRDTQLIDAERERQTRRRQRKTLPLEQAPAAPSQGAPVALAPSLATSPRPASDDGPDRRWLVLLKVGRDELAGIWDGSLESCEPSVWRPATKTWAPLFEVPQIATLVTATVKQRQQNPRASVPASPAPRRRQSSATLASGGRRSSVPPPAPQGSGTESARHDTLRPSSLAEVGGTSPELSPAARLTVRAPYIPPPPRVPTLVTAKLPAFNEDSTSGTVPYAVAALRQPYAPAPSYAPAPAYGAAQSHNEAQSYNPAQSYREAHAHQAAQAFAAAEETAQPSYSETRAIPLTRRAEPSFPHYPPTENSFTPADAVPWSEPMSQHMHPQAAADSYAPHAHSITTPLTPPRPATLTERAGWLFAGVAAALVLTTFTGLSSSMREGLADWVDPKPGTLLASALLTSDQQASASGAADAISEAEAQAKREHEQAQANANEKHDDTRTVSVDDLPILTKSGKLVSGDSSKGDERAAETPESSHDSVASAGGRAHARHGADSRERAASSTSVKLSSLPHSEAAAPTPKPAPKPQALGFDAAAARRALASAVGRAQFCSGERATGTIVVTFAPAGGVASASLASIEGVDVRKGCVVTAFRGARIMPFQGDPVTVQKSFQLR